MGVEIISTDCAGFRFQFIDLKGQCEQCAEMSSDVSRGNDVVTAWSISRMLVEVHRATVVETRDTMREKQYLATNRRYGYGAVKDEWILA